jgi:prepilin-type N-terminal cleavage/methylation domain-containing protein
MKVFKQIFLSKDKKKNTLPAFTLVELVIVITILAILSTI